MTRRMKPKDLRRPKAIRLWFLRPPGGGDAGRSLAGNLSLWGIF